VGNTPLGHSSTRLSSVHPHACGEYEREPRSATANRAVHPHACGEYVGRYGQHAGLYGPPPRVWGIRAAPSTCRLPSPVHPHACGEYVWGVLCHGAPGGPPPRVWGIRRHGSASAGDLTVHPHACGEYEVLTLADSDVNGPPPRVWGILTGRPRCTPPAWSTPTRVGNTRPSASSPPASPVHPHACGEYAAVAFAASIACGPPPRVWGIPPWLCQNRPALRSTPTRVGNTWCAAA